MKPARRPGKPYPLIGLLLAILAGGTSAVWQLWPDHRASQIGGGLSRLVTTQTRYLVILPLVLSGIIVYRLIRRHFELRAQAGALARQVFYDPLTGLPNRMLFLERLNHAQTRVERRNILIAVLFVDLDGFKQVNDTFGHARGDELLRSIGAFLQSCVRPEDTVARLSGDEFALLLEDVKGLAGAVQVAQRITSSISTPFNLSGDEVAVTASIGIAVNTSGREAAEELMRRADTAMYEAKQHKSGYAVFDTQLNSKMQEEIQLRTELRQAIERNQFVLYYQPIVDLVSGQIVCLEALVRWLHPHRGLLLPRHFIPLAEESGLIVPLNRLVLQEACAQLRSWRDTYPSLRNVALAVNVSGYELRPDRMKDDVRSILEETQVDPRALQFEFVEQTLHRHEHHTHEAVQLLQTMGSQVAIDEFGSGNSSLVDVRRCRAKVVKIDRSFVSPGGRLELDEAFICAVRTYTSMLGITLVAVGVETVEQLNLLRKAACPFGQGNAISPPLLPTHVPQLLEQSQALTTRS